MRPTKAALLGLLALLAAALVEPDVALRDAGELGAAAQTLGVAHPTGFPVDMLLWRASTLVPLGPLAFRQNLATALVASLAVWLVARFTQALGARVGYPPWAASLGALVAAAGLGTFATFVQAATSIEVYVLSVALAAGAALAATHRRSGTAALLLGLALGSHVSAIVPCATAALAARPLGSRLGLAPDTRARAAAIAVRLTLVLLGAATIAYLPLASLANPPLDWGDPDTLGRLIDHLTARRIRAAYDAAIGAGLGPSQRRVGAQLLELGPLLVLGVGGAVALARRSPRAALALALVVAADVAYALFVNPMGAADRQTLHVAAGALAALSGAAVSAVAGLPREPRARRRSAALLGIGAVAFVANGARGLLEGHDPTGLTSSELFGSGGLLAVLPPRAVFVCSSDDGCAGALFATYAEAARPDVTVVPAQHLWESAVARRLPAAVRPYDADREPADASRAPVARARAHALVAPGRALPACVEDLGAAPDADLTADASGLCFAPSPARAGLADALRRLDASTVARGVDGTLGVRARALYAQRYDHLGEAALTESPGIALRAYRSSVELAPERAAGWSNLGVALEPAHPRSALAAYAHATELEPRRPTPWVNRVRLLDRLGDRRGAAEVLEAARAAGVRDPRLDGLRRSFASP